MKHAQRACRGLRSYWLLAGVAFIAAAGIGTAWHAGAPDPVQISAATAARSNTRRETRPTLDPARFVGKAAVAHQIARDIPDVLDHLYCYCECDKHAGHKSLLSCYTDGHAAT